MKLGVSMFFGVLVLAMSVPVPAQENAEAGRDLTFTCTGCHSIAGMRNAYPGYTVPKIGGQKADYLLAALKAYRDGTREHPTMHAQTVQFSDQDLANIAAYFSSIPKN